MRPNQGNRRNNNRRGGHGGHSGHGGGGHGNNGGHQVHRDSRQPRTAMSLRNQIFDSNGPDMRVRGNAFQVHEKYLALAKDALSSGDRVLAENYLQHAEHYFRIIEAINEATASEQRTRQATYADQPQGQQQQPQQQQQPGSGYYSNVSDMTSQPATQTPLGSLRNPMMEDGESQQNEGNMGQDDDDGDGGQHGMTAAAGRR